MKYGQWDIAFKRTTNGDSLRRFRIMGWLRDTETDIPTTAHETMYAAFASILTRIDVSGSPSIPFDMASATLSPDGARRAYEAWLDMDEEFTDACYTAIAESRRPVDPITGPEPLPEGAKKKTETPA